MANSKADLGRRSHVQCRLQDVNNKRGLLEILSNNEFLIVIDNNRGEFIF